MTATNKPMTGAQLDELMAVAMRMQSDSEKMGERSVSMFAYAVQIAVLEIRETRCKYEELQSQNEELAVQLANAESKCRELVAENATLNDKMNRLATWPGIEFYSSSWEFCNLDGNDALEFMCDVQTPATDAFLAEVRAQGVDEFATELGNVYQQLRSGSNHAHAIKSAVFRAVEFAAQLRKGAKS